MKSIFVANVIMGKNEGIYKKVCAEAAALGKTIGESILIIQDQTGSKIINPATGNEDKDELNALQKAKKLILQNEIKVLYIRLMIPNFDLISLMKTAKRLGTKVLYEIPTYPYYAEQFRSSRKKYRAIVKIALDYVFSPLVYKYCDRMVVIRSNQNKKLKPKMIEISNGVKTDSIKEKSYPKVTENAFRMVTVGTLYPYHGYDRILKGLKLCNELVDGIPVEFHVVGESETISALKNESHELGLQRVFFHGVKTTNELNTMFEMFDVGLGCLALHRRNANIDTTLKIIEYYCRGVPVVTSGKSPYRDQSVTITVPDNEDPISVEDIYRQWKCIPINNLKSLSSNAKLQFDWDRVFEDLFSKLDIR